MLHQGTILCSPARLLRRGNPAAHHCIHQEHFERDNFCVHQSSAQEKSPGIAKTMSVGAMPLVMVFQSFLEWHKFSLAPRAYYLQTNALWGIELCRFLLRRVVHCMEYVTGAKFVGFDPSEWTIGSLQESD